MVSLGNSPTSRLTDSVIIQESFTMYDRIISGELKTKLN
jgi:hypothetical protein